jgi:hypothetical protein
MRAPIRPRGLLAPPGGPVIYTCPLTFFWGVVALHAFRVFRFPLSISKILFFMGGKVFLIHLFDMLPITNSAIAKYTRQHEQGTIPWIRFKRVILTTIQVGNLGFISDIFRERLFLTISQRLSDILAFIGHKMTT